MVNNNGGEYILREFKDLTETHGIKMSLTVPYTPQQNPVAKISNRTTTEKAWALLKQASLPAEFWAEAVITAVYLENITPLASQNWTTLFELWHKIKPRYDHLRKFGYLCYAHVGKERRSGKFGDMAKKGVLLGYQEGKHNYQVWLINEKRVVYSHNVVFNESVFPFSATQCDFIDEDDIRAESAPVQAPVTPVISPAGSSDSIRDPPVEDDSSSEFSTSDLLIPLSDLTALDQVILPKPSFTYAPTSSPAPRNISRNIDQDTILSYRRQADAASAHPANSSDPVSS